MIHVNHKFTSGYARACIYVSYRIRWKYTE